jgi:hemolysin activation/secretion protein
MKPYSLAAALLAAAAPGLSWAQIIDQQRTDRRPPTATREAPRPATQAPQAGRVVSEVSEAAATPLRRVVVTGSSLSAAAFETATRPLVGQPLSQATVSAAANAAAEVYGKSDIALYTLVAPNQDLSGGELRLQAIEGHIDQVALQGDVRDRDLSLVTAMADKLTLERPLRKPTLERYLSLIRDIPGETVEAQLLQGRAPGAVILALGLKQQRATWDLSVNNSGSAILGRTQLQATGNLHGLLRAGDHTSLTVGVPTDAERFRYYALTHSQPLGSEGLRVQGNVGYYRTRPKNLPIEGEATFGGVQVSYPMIRGYQTNLYLTGALDGLNSSNAVFGQGVADERTRVLRGSAAWSRIKPRSALSASAVASAGLDDLGARALPGLADTDFRKLNLRAGVDRAIGSSFVVRLRAMSQSSNDLLPASEQVPLGGQEFGRAFEQAVVIGDYGKAGSAELGWRPQGLPESIKGSELYGFVDGGTATRRPRPGIAAQRYDMASAGAGVRVAVNTRTVVGLEGAYGFDPPIPGQDKSWRLGVSFRMLR